MSRFLSWLDRGPLVADGAWGTELQKQGLPPGVASDGWNLLHPDEVEAVARSYAEAGSDLVTTNTFQANRIRLELLGLADRTAEVNRAGVVLARRGAPAARVLGAVGPIGLGGAPTAVEVADAYRDQVRALADAGADALLLETMYDPDEAALALAEARATGLPVVVSIAFGADRTARGRSPEALGRVLRDAGADAVGANCGDGPGPFPELCRRLREGSGLPVWAKPSAGLPRPGDAGPAYPASPDDFAALWPALRQAGVVFVGGCCGAGPGHLRALARAVKASKG